VRVSSDGIGLRFLSGPDINGRADAADAGTMLRCH
jgi:hypothetical protein